MGGNGHGGPRPRRDAPRASSGRPGPTALLALTLLLVGAGCDDGADSPQATTPAGEPVVTEVGQNDALTALVRWHVDEAEPVVDDEGDIVLPVVYVTSGSGETIDVGVQAAVAEQTVDDAVVRFADDRSEAVDDDADGSPVKDDGVLMLLGAMPAPAPSVTFPVTVYRAVDDEQTLAIEATATATGVEITATPMSPN